MGSGVDMKAPGAPWAAAVLAAAMLGAVAPASLGSSVESAPAPVVTADAAAAPRPNIVMVLVDDVPRRTLDAMPFVRRQVAGKGVTYRNAVIPSALCCPSRAALLTGRYAHSTRMYLNGDEGATDLGGWPSFRRWEASTLAVRLDRNGYHTALVGKYLNMYQPARSTYVPEGWDRFVTFRTPIRDYYDYSLIGTVQERHGRAAADYLTDVLARHAVRLVQNAPVRRPLFLLYAPLAAHDPYLPAPRHVGDWHNEPLGRAFNEQDMSDKPRWFASMPLRSREVQTGEQRRQHEMLMSVDEGVRAIVRALGTRIRNTLVIYLSDNGYVHGAHRVVGKNVAYADASEVPLVMRWDGHLPAGSTSGRVTPNVDVSATIADAAGVRWARDGRSVLSHDRRGSLLEQTRYGRPAYCGYRTSRYLYVRWSRGREELYDYRTDPAELTSLHRSRAYADVRATLRSLTDQTCRPRPPGFRWS
jgi:arylsulfatase A-like enzyme